MTQVFRGAGLHPIDARVDVVHGLLADARRGVGGFVRVRTRRLRRILSVAAGRVGRVVGIAPRLVDTTLHRVAGLVIGVAAAAGDVRELLGGLTVGLAGRIAEVARLLLHAAAGFRTRTRREQQSDARA